MPVVKWIAVFLLLLASLAVGTSVVDACPEDEGGDCPPMCHLACLDGCTVVPLEVGPPVLKPLGLTPERRLNAAFTPLELAFPPEIFPPKT
ncbi:MAG: hypothetical protein SF066_12190 [Thermoanaerobaculia bacterium]|nr:hypothetical protein [Thermoanaerobaculia bacterium]